MHVIVKGIYIKILFTLYFILTCFSHGWILCDGSSFFSSGGGDNNDTDDDFGRGVVGAVEMVADLVEVLVEVMTRSLAHLCAHTVHWRRT